MLQASIEPLHVYQVADKKWKKDKSLAFFLTMWPLLVFVLHCVLWLLLHYKLKKSYDIALRDTFNGDAYVLYLLQKGRCFCAAYLEEGYYRFCSLSFEKATKARLSRGRKCERPRCFPQKGKTKMETDYIPHFKNYCEDQPLFDVKCTMCKVYISERPFEKKIVAVFGIDIFLAIKSSIIHRL